MLKPSYQLDTEQLVKDVTAVLQALAKSAKDSRAEMGAEMVALRQAVSEIRKQINDAQSTSIKDIKDIVDKRLASALAQVDARVAKSLSSVEMKLSEQQTGMNYIYDKVDALKDGDPGADADEEAVAQKVQAALMPILNEWDKKMEEEIARLREEMSKIPRGRTSGGTSAMGVRQAFKYIAHTEQPVGAIDGNNTTYTLKNDIWWIAGFTLNGETIAQLPNFTIAGRTITFSTALPAAYSGKDWEVKYIG